MNFEDLKSLAQIYLSDFAGNEQNVKYKIVVPFLNCFGHDKFEFEHAAQGSRIDINIDNKIIIETKALDKKLDDYVSQVETYCNKERPYLAILTNGQDFRFYSPFMRIPRFADTLIYEFALTDFANEEVVARIDKIIGIENYRNNNHRKFIEEREYELEQTKNEIQKNNPKNHEPIEAIKKEIKQFDRKIEDLKREKEEKNQMIQQIVSNQESKKMELSKKHFIPSIQKGNKIKNTRVVMENQPIDESVIYKIDKIKTDVKAQGKYSDIKRFTVLSGSKVSKREDPTFGKGVADGAYKLRKQLEESGKINANREFIEDHTFDSISQAACVVLGGSRNGKKEWKS